MIVMRPAGPRRSVGLAILLLFLTAVLCRPGLALSPGRDWLPIDTLSVPSHTRLLPTGIALDPYGRPMLYAAAVGGIGSDYSALSWDDTSWVERWRLGHGISFLYSGDALTHSYPIVWQELPPENPSLSATNTPSRIQLSPGYLVMSEDLLKSYAAPDTIAAVDPYSFFFSCAASSARRWAIKIDSRVGLRLFTCSLGGVWIEHVIQTQDVRDIGGAAIQVIDDTSLVVVWSQFGLRHLRWGLLKADEWYEGPPSPFPTGYMTGTVALHRLSNTSVWVGWAESEPYGRMAHLDVVARSWSAPMTITSEFRLPGDWHTNAIWVAADNDSVNSASGPIIAWQAWNGQIGAINTLNISVPADSGGYKTENLIGTDGIAQAQVARDANEDIWVVWWNNELEGMFWTHSVVGATARGLNVAGGGAKPLLCWTLTEPAPGSWWTVLRAESEGSFEAVGRVRAGRDTEMIWVDTQPVRGHVRYRLRRDCVDKRYEWLSEEALWPAKSRKPLVALAARPLDSGTVAFAVEEAAAGPLRIEVYDIQGRRVLRRIEPVAGPASRTWTLDLRQLEPRLTSGIYFLRVTDAAGDQSEAAKVVVLQ